MLEKPASNHQKRKIDALLQATPEKTFSRSMATIMTPTAIRVKMGASYTEPSARKIGPPTVNLRDHRN